MPLPDLTEFCIIQPPVVRLCVTFPGGATVCAPSGGRIPDPSEMTAALLGPLNAALAPMMPIFDILDLLMAMVNCIKAVEDALGPPPRPDKLAACFPDLARKLSKVLRLMPQLSVPVLIGGILDVIIMFLVGARRQLLALIRKQLLLVGAQLRARELGSVDLFVVIDCAQAGIDAELANLNADAVPIARLLGVLNLLLGLVGLPEIAPMEELGTDVQAAVAPLDRTIELLTGIRRSLP